MSARRHHGRKHWSVHRAQFLTDSDTRGLGPRLRHHISPFSMITSDIRRQETHLSQESRH